MNFKSVVTAVIATAVVAPALNAEILEFSFARKATQQTIESGGSLSDASALEGRFANGRKDNHTYKYEISGQNIGGDAVVAHLKAVSLASTPEEARNLNSARGNGLVVAGGYKSSQWDTGEDIQFDLSLLDADGNDVTANYTVDLVAARIRWQTRTGGDGPVTATFNDEDVSPTSAKPAYEIVSLATGQASETSVLATRSGPHGVAQLGTLSFKIAPAAEQSAESNSPAEPEASEITATN